MSRGQIALSQQSYFIAHFPSFNWKESEAIFATTQKYFKILYFGLWGGGGGGGSEADPVSS